MHNRRKQLFLVLAVFGFVVIADQISKAIILSTIPVNSRTVWENPETFFFFTHQRNPGLVGGAFSDTPLVARLAPLAATIVLLFLFRHLDRNAVFQNVAFGMIAGGAVGNLIDRFRFGEVVDFLQFHFYFIPFDFYWKQYPAFNFADSAICVGVFVLIFTWRHVEKPQQEANVSDAA